MEGNSKKGPVNTFTAWLKWFYLLSQVAQFFFIDLYAIFAFHTVSAKNKGSYNHKMHGWCIVLGQRWLLHVHNASAVAAPRCCTDRLIFFPHLSQQWYHLCLLISFLPSFSAGTMKATPVASNKGAPWRICDQKMLRNTIARECGRPRSSAQAPQSRFPHLFFFSFLGTSWGPCVEKHNFLLVYRKGKKKIKSSTIGWRN